MFKTDYTRITKPGEILAVRLPGIYADVANTENAIVNTNYANGQISQATGFRRSTRQELQPERKNIDQVYFHTLPETLAA